MIQFLFILLLLTVQAHAATALSQFGFQQRPGNQVPTDTLLHDESGHDVRLGQLMNGEPTIFVLGYFRCPNLCGIVRADVFDALSRSGLDAKQYSLIVLSINPAESNADATIAKREDLARYPLPGADHAWHYLTGPAAALTQIANAVGFRDRYDRQLKQFLHPAGLVFLNPAGQISGYLLGVGYTPGDLASSVARARSGSIERATSSVLLLCFHFDPSTGRYTLAITKLMQIAGLLTVATIGGTIALALRRERSR
jgi:protein SCO1/2